MLGRKAVDENHRSPEPPAEDECATRSSSKNKECGKAFSCGIRAAEHRSSIPKTILVGLFLCGICNAHQHPRLIRVSIQYIEVAHPALTEWMSGSETSGPAIHAKAMALSKTGGGKILETCMVICRSGQKATAESIREEIYPTEYAPPGLPGSFGSGPRDRTPPADPMNPKLRSPTAFESRDTGVTLEVEPTVGTNGQIIDLRFSSEIVSRLRLETWMEHKDPWGAAPVRMPIFEKWGSKSLLSLQSGKFEVAAVIAPKTDAPVPAVTHRILLFVRADTLPDPRSR